MLVLVLGHNFSLSVVTLSVVAVPVQGVQAAHSLCYESFEMVICFCDPAQLSWRVPAALI